MKETYLKVHLKDVSLRTDMTDEDIKKSIETAKYEIERHVDNLYLVEIVSEDN